MFGRGTYKWERGAFLFQTRLVVNSVVESQYGKRSGPGFCLEIEVSIGHVICKLWIKVRRGRSPFPVCNPRTS